MPIAVLRSLRHEAALHALERELRPEPHRVTEARERAKRLIEELDEKEDARMFSVRRAIEHGSHSRDTALAGFKDMDFLVVLEPEALRTSTGSERSATDTVVRMAGAIAERRAGMVTNGIIEVRAQDHSVGIKYPRYDLRIDLVPAVRTAPRRDLPHPRAGQPCLGRHAAGQPRRTARRGGDGQSPHPWRHSPVEGVASRSGQGDADPVLRGRVAGSAERTTRPADARGDRAPRVRGLRAAVEEPTTDPPRPCRRRVRYAARSLERQQRDRRTDRRTSGASDRQRASRHRPAR
jgi:hypothetical protein